MIRFVLNLNQSSFQSYLSAGCLWMSHLRYLWYHLALTKLRLALFCLWPIDLLLYREYNSIQSLEQKNKLKKKFSFFRDRIYLETRIFMKNWKLVWFLFRNAITVFFNVGKVDGKLVSTFAWRLVFHSLWRTWKSNGRELNVGTEIEPVSLPVSSYW